MRPLWTSGASLQTLRASDSPGRYEAGIGATAASVFTECYHQRMASNLRYVVVQEDNTFVARCLDVEVASDGPTEAAAIEALKEALQLYFSDSDLADQCYLSLGRKNNF